MFKCEFEYYFSCQTNGQAEHDINTLKNKLRACVIDLNVDWDDHQLIIMFAYNNSYNSSIQMSPYDDLYGRRCISPIGLFEVGKARLTEPYSVYQAIFKVKLIQER